MAKVEFDPRTVTLGEIGEIYQKSQGTKSKPTFTKDLFNKYMDVPVLELFDDTDGDSIVRTLVRTAAENEDIPESSLKSLMQNLRNVNVFLRRQMGKEAPPYLIKTDDAKQGALDLFGFEEPAKAKAELGISMTPERRQQFFTELLKYGAENPKEMPAVRAVIFGMNTGLRPGAYVITGKDSGMRPDYYLPEDGALYIPPEATGAKGRKITVPLNAMADSMIQQQLAMGLKGDYIFSFEDGKPVKSADVNKVLANVKVPRFIFNEADGKYYDNFMLDKDAATKKGVQILRNYHATWGASNGVDPVVLAKLQGRSGKSSARGPTGELFTYVSNYPGEVSEYEREQANQFAATYQKDIEKSKSVIHNIVDPTFTFDTGNVSTDVVQERITTSTEGFENYFDRPVTESTPTVTIGTAEKKAVSDSSRASWVDKLTKLGKSGLGGLGVLAIGTAAEEAYSQELQRGGTEGTAVAAGVLRGGYELLETPVMMGVTPAKTAGPELADQPADLPGKGPQETEFTRQQAISAMDARQAAIDEQMSRIRAYDERAALDRQMNELKPDIEVKYPARK